MNKNLRVLRAFALAVVGVAVGANFAIIIISNKFVIKNIDKVPHNTVALVLGARTYKDHLSSVLQDRVDAGIALKSAGVVEKLLLSGDHSPQKNDETNSMLNYVLAKEPGIKKEDIFLDHAGINTYNSIVRAREIYGIESMVIVTQEFHMARSVFIARCKGINAVGYALDEDKYPIGIRLSWSLREFLARIKALCDVVIDRKPTFMGQKMPITGDGQYSWNMQ